MLDSADSRVMNSPFATDRMNAERGVTTRWQRLAETAILILGSPRSGTTWLAKIFDSHPDVLYRHEPDELSPAALGLDPAEQIRQWLRQRGPRAAAKRPNFQKSWRPAPLDNLRKVFAATLGLTQRWAPLTRASQKISVPDLIVPSRSASVRAAIKLVNWDGILSARSMPNARHVFILRHPCGQIASLMAGMAAKRFDLSYDQSQSPVDIAAAAAWARRRGIEQTVFSSLPDAAKYAWGWLAFNEPAVEALGDLPNTRIVIYEDLCREPEALSRALFTFAGLDWHPQTATFLANSTQHDRPAGYYDVFRSTGLVADRWRQTMSQRDQDAVRMVLSTSPLANRWPGLALREA